jgi:hypothetical protein
MALVWNPMVYRWLFIWLISLLGVRAQETWLYFDNGKVRVGINLNAGGSIGWLSKAQSPDNLLNSFDHGRYVQQSFYGDADGSDWNGKPWRYNPVQGGSWKGVPAVLLEHKETATESYVKTQPRQWASGLLVEDMVMEQWLKLEGDQVHLRYRMRYTGKIAHKARHQEMPAVFVTPRCDTLVFCDKGTGEVTRKQPGQPNEYFHTKEPWLAWVDAAQDGMGVYFPGTDFLTAYRVRNGNKGDVSYAAPLRTLALTPGYELEYRAVLVLGKLDRMRQAFSALAKTGTK